VPPGVRARGRAAVARAAARGDGVQVAVARAAAGKAEARDLDEFGGNAFDVQLPVSVPRAGRLKGTVRAVVVADEQLVEIKDIKAAKDAERKINGQRLLFSAMNLAPQEWLVILTIYDTKPVAANPQMNVRIVDGKGNVTTPGGNSMHSNGSRMDFSFEFRQRPDHGAPVKFTFVPPGGAGAIEIPFVAAKVIEHKVDAGRLLLNVLNPQQGQWFVTLVAEITDPKMPSFGELQPGLIDAKGNALALTGRTGGGGGARSDQQLLFIQGPGAGPPVKLTLRMPKSTREIDIPFKFEGKKLAAANGDAKRQ
jgi:hypothetical protein